jgi:hypothetical protein
VGALGVPITYEIGFYSGQGDRAGSWSLVGAAPLWDVERSSLSANIHTVGTELSYGIRDQTAKLIVELPLQNAVKRWLETAGVHETQLLPFRSRQSGTTQGVGKVLLLPDLYTWRYTDNVKPMECAGDRLRSYQPPIDVVAVDNSVRWEFFPWLEPSTAPKSSEALREWLSYPAVQDKMRELGVRYLLSFHGGTKTETPGGGIFCGGGYGGGGCLGYAWGKRESAFDANLIELRDPATAVELSARESSGVYIPAFILPIPFLAPTESVACDRLARDIYQALSLR